MHNKIAGFFIVLLLLVSNHKIALGEQRKAGESVSSSHSERSEIPERIRDQIKALSDGAKRKHPQFMMVGELSKLGSNQFSVNGEVFLVDEKTVVNGPLTPGRRAEVRGKLVHGKPKVASQISTSAPSASEAASSSLRSTDTSQRSFPPNPELTR